MYKQLVEWSKKNYSLPWREERTAYTTLVSEIMLQQTTVPTVLRYYHTFLKRFPTIDILAKASEVEVLQAWKGLGYYRRAKNLHRCAVYISTELGGKIPNEYEDLINIPGVGDYTASAILSMAMGKSFISVDANLERVLSRIFNLNQPIGLPLKKEIKTYLANQKINVHFGDLNEAIMDLGREVCVAKKPRCSNCPVAKFCFAFNHNKIEKLPVRKESKKVKDNFELSLLRVLVKKDNLILSYKKNEDEWLAGQYELPTFILDTNDKNLSQYPKWSKKLDLKKLPSYRSLITKYKITNYVLIVRENEFKKNNLLKRCEYVSVKDKKKVFSTSVDKSLKVI